LNIIKTVLITGTSRGIGLALAIHFLNNGYKVIGTSRTGEISNFSDTNFKVIKLDLSDKNSIKEIDKIFKKEKYIIDILINNAGIGPDLDSEKPEIESFTNTFDVNVTGTVFLTELLSQYLTFGGKTINISSKMGSILQCSQYDSVAYRMSKAALNMYTKILTNRLFEKKVIASIHPGWVRTTISKNSQKNGRLSVNESAERIFNFVISDFESGIFWDAEKQSKIKW
jgi:short-subunit dehydrogenase